MRKTLAIILVFFFFFSSAYAVNTFEIDLVGDGYLPSDTDWYYFLNPQQSWNVPNLSSMENGFLIPFGAVDTAEGEPAIVNLRFAHQADSWYYAYVHDDTSYTKGSDNPTAVAWPGGNGTHEEIRTIFPKNSRGAWRFNPSLWDGDLANETKIRVAGEAIRGPGDPQHPWAYIDSDGNITVLLDSGHGTIWESTRNMNSTEYNLPGNNLKDEGIEGFYPTGGEGYISWVRDGYLHIAVKNYIGVNPFWQVIGKWPVYTEASLGWPSVSISSGRVIYTAYLNKTDGSLWMAELYPEVDYKTYNWKVDHWNLSNGAAMWPTIGIEPDHGYPAVAWIDSYKRNYAGAGYYIWTSYFNGSGWNTTVIEDEPIEDLALFGGMKIALLGEGTQWAGGAYWTNSTSVVVIDDRTVGDEFYIWTYQRQIEGPQCNFYHNNTWPQRWDLEVNYSHSGYSGEYPYFRIAVYDETGYAWATEKNVSQIPNVNHTTYFVFNETGDYDIVLEGGLSQYGPWTEICSSTVTITPNIVIGQVMPVKPYFTINENLRFRWYKQNLPPGQDWWMTLYQPKNTTGDLVNATWTGDEIDWKEYLEGDRYEKVVRRKVYPSEANETWHNWTLPSADSLGITRMPVVCAFESSNKRRYNFTQGHAMQYSMFMLYYSGIECNIEWEALNSTVNSSGGLKITVNPSGLAYAHFMDRYIFQSKFPEFSDIYTPGISPWFRVYLSGPSGIHRRIFMPIYDYVRPGQTVSERAKFERESPRTFQNFEEENWIVSTDNTMVLNVPPGRYQAKVYLEQVWYEVKKFTPGQVKIQEGIHAELFPTPINVSEYQYILPDTDESYTYNELEGDLNVETGFDFSLFIGLGVLGAICVAPMIYLRSAWPVVIFSSVVGIVVLSGGLLPGYSVWYAIVPIAIGIAVFLANLFGGGRFGGGGGPGV